jgi:alpha-1,3-mannosyltransferase
MGCGWVETFMCLSICAGVQLALGMPFLATYPVEYITRSFDLGRAFFFKWTVNFKFLPEDVFLSKSLSILLLLSTVAVLALFAYKWIAENRLVLKLARLPFIGVGRLTRGLNPHFIIVTIFLSNFIGVVFARTLHYQFYVWYFHTLPYLLWSAKRLPVRLKLLLLVNIELAFNVYPATPWSSVMLQVSHFVLLVGLYLSPAPLAVQGRGEGVGSDGRKDD